MSPRSIAAVLFSILLSYLALLSIPFIWIGIFASLPFLSMKSWKNAFTGLGIGVLTSASLYLVYPAQMISRLAGILSSISGLPQFAIMSVYPLIYGLIFGLSALLWSSVNIETVRSRTDTG